ncbi:PaaI family thioesterase [Mycobacterium sp. NAZ190054]|uniref:PaaI family thioesterase n=1 Tax=Mycobacterium sp. NAZ190054 TaxID=1747766 RepID=UPI00079469A8|nr:PaaI family thioesterase [Mycobacterium sp. NAZ190054]KWX57350.1 hypothetical protein ASJ79_11595 [Mycobacterium sp. NAZ190054]
MTADRAVLDAFAHLVAASGRVRDALVTVGGDVETMTACARRLDEVADTLRQAAIAPGAQDVLATHNPDPRYGVRSRGLVPRHEVHVDDGWRLVGSTTVERHFDGVGAVHGGAIAMLFDDLLGRLANSAGRPMARTAYLHVNFRAPVPWGTPLTFSCRIAQITGRKRFLEGELTRDGELLTDVNGLWVELRPAGCASGPPLPGSAR